MPPDDKIPDLQTALRTWVDDALVYLREHAESSIVQSATEQWQLAEDGTYRRGVVVKASMLREGAEQVRLLPSYEVLEGAARSSPIVGPMIGQMIGTGMGLSQFNLWQLTNAALPPASEIISGTETVAFDDRYAELMRQLTKTDAIYETICFIQGASFETEQFDLAPGLAITKLTATEVGDALDHGLLTSPFGSLPVFQPQETASFGLKRTTPVPRIIGPDITDEQRQAVMKVQDMTEDAEELIQCLSLLTRERIAATGQITMRTDSDFTMLDSATWFRSYSAPRSFMGSGYHLDASKCAELQTLWGLAHNESFPQNKALALALRRLGFATQRERPEDRLLDVFIAAEAFYLTAQPGDAKDRGELKYRLALRAAVWSDDTLDGWTKRQVFHHMRRGYDIRSTIAHGGEPKAKDLRVKDQAVDLPTFVQATEEILRTALYKSLRQLPGTSSRLVISWDDLILPELE